MKKTLTFNDVLIVPKFSDISSRNEVVLTSSITKTPYYTLQYNLPVISANMDTVTDHLMAKTMLNYGAQACLHRFYSIEENIKAFNHSKTENGYVPMVSIGIGSKELERAEALFNNGANTFIIDVAHGAQMSVVNQAKNLSQIIKNNGAIIVGNFASEESVKTFLEYAGTCIDSIKVGIGPGSACTTRIKTGVGYPQFSAVYNISNCIKNTGIGVIADGGMKTPGDIAKAIGAGASMVMLGGMLSGTDESPGEVVTKDSVLYKKYRGSASMESYQDQGKVGKHRTAEGESFLVPYKGSVNNILQDIEGGLRSAFTYVGAKNLKDFQSKCEFVEISAASYVEGTPHGKK